MSHDMEDVVAVIDGRSELLDEIKVSEDDVRTYLADEFKIILADPTFQDALPGYLPGDQASQARLGIVKERLMAIAGK